MVLTRETEVVGEYPVAVPLCPPKKLIWIDLGLKVTA
jgi:hypothetical protein